MQYALRRGCVVYGIPRPRPVMAVGNAILVGHATEFDGTHVWSRGELQARVGVGQHRPAVFCGAGASKRKIERIVGNVAIVVHPETSIGKPQAVHGIEIPSAIGEDKLLFDRRCQDIAANLRMGERRAVAVTVAHLLRKSKQVITPVYMALGFGTRLGIAQRDQAGIPGPDGIVENMIAFGPLM